MAVDRSQLPERWLLWTQKYTPSDVYPCRLAPEKDDNPKYVKIYGPAQSFAYGVRKDRVFKTRAAALEGLKAILLRMQERTEKQLAAVEAALEKEQS